MKKKADQNSNKRRRVSFSFDAGSAKEVFIAGDFNEWNPTKHAMQHSEEGQWKKTLMLPPGHYEYKCVVDGRWANDPSNEEVCGNTFGTTNNILQIK